MKTLQKFALTFGLIGLLYSCQSTNQILSKPDKRVEIINAIANDEMMSKEMMGLLMNSKSGKMIMMQNHLQIMESISMKMIVEKNPEMKQKMQMQMEKMMEDNSEMKEKMQTKMLDKMMETPEGRKMLMKKMHENKEMQGEMKEKMRENPAMMEEMMEKMMRKKPEMMKKMKNEKQ